MLSKLQVLLPVLIPVLIRALRASGDLIPKSVLPLIAIVVGVATVMLTGDTDLATRALDGALGGLAGIGVYEAAAKHLPGMKPRAD